MLLNYDIKKNQTLVEIQRLPFAMRVLTVKLM